MMDVKKFERISTVEDNDFNEKMLNEEDVRTSNSKICRRFLLTQIEN